MTDVDEPRQRPQNDGGAGQRDGPSEADEVVGQREEEGGEDHAGREHDVRRETDPVDEVRREGDAEKEENDEEGGWKETVDVSSEKAPDVVGESADPPFCGSEEGRSEDRSSAAARLSAARFGDGAAAAVRRRSLDQRTSDGVENV